MSPHWPLVAAKVPPDVPAAVVKANRVVEATPAALAQRVAVGMRRRESQGRCPQLEVIEHDPDRDARYFEPVVAALERFTPRVEILGPGRCSFPTRGPSRYFGGDRSLADQIVQTLRAEIAALFTAGGCPAGYEPKVGVADGLFSAALAAEVVSARADTCALVIEPGASRSFIAPMAVSELQRWSAPLDDGENLVGLFWRLGLKTLGDVARLPPSDLLARFGSDGLRAHQLASGLDERPPDTRPVPPESIVEVRLDPPADRVDTASFVAKAMADDLHQRLGRDGLACTRIIVEATTAKGECHSRVWRHEGALSASDVADRMRWQLDGWLSSRHRPTSGIILLRLIPDEVVADVGRQLGFWGGQTLESQRAARALARVQGILGPDSVAVPEKRGGRGLAEAIGQVALPFVDITDPDRSLEAPAASAPWPGRLPAPNPTLLGGKPIAEVLDDLGHPVEVSGRGDLSGPPTVVVWSDGSRSAVDSWAGPWPIDERWWEPRSHRRAARFQFVLSDGSAHIVSLSQRSWVHDGTYD
ncbi:MAG: DNA polymerase Y family protein [Acidimicrobiales bacterium]|nr:DNA polymerase Y family protein [Acidimicrobiales bacterium]